MKSDWVIDVLSDLKEFAQQNDLPILAEQLDDTAIIALSEMTANLEDTNTFVEKAAHLEL